jgi:hypothetical protein
MGARVLCIKGGIEGEEQVLPPSRSMAPLGGVGDGLKTVAVWYVWSL